MLEIIRALGTSSSDSDVLSVRAIWVSSSDTLVHFGLHLHRFLAGSPAPWSRVPVTVTVTMSPVTVTVSPVTMSVVIVSVSPWVTMVPTATAPRSVTVTMSVSVSVSLVQQGRSPNVDGRVAISLKRSGLSSDQPRVFGFLVVIDLVAGSAVFQVEVFDILVRGQRSTSSPVFELGGAIVGNADVSPSTIVLSVLSASSLDDWTSSRVSVRDGEAIRLGGARSLHGD